MNTTASYESFLQRYPNEALSSRARGNLEYITGVRDNPEPIRLQKFVGQFPESDFLREAKNTLELLDYLIETDIRKLGFRDDVAPNVRQPERVRRGFAAVVAREYQDQGIEVQLIPVGEEVPADIDAWMRIDYHEAPASGTFGGRTLLSHCRIRLFHKNSEEPVWDRRFEAPADHIIQGAYGRDKTVFANSTYRFWSEFFVPVSTWAASGVLVHRQELREDLAAIDVRGDRAAMLYVRGPVVPHGRTSMSSSLSTMAVSCALPTPAASA